ncbi:MAG TPA: Dyp-type peroxidase [Microbacteriaceae bacterium]|nr:Dyp-type peroxidase [Microbacteriaceae bacterium]
MTNLPSKGLSRQSLSRRGLFTGVLAGASTVGALASASAGFPGAKTLAGNPIIDGDETIPATGMHQAGIITPPTAHIRYLAYSLKPETDREALTRLFRILTADIEALTSGEPPIVDTEPELAEVPARLTVTVGFGPELVNRVDPALRPEWLAPLPAFSRDQLGDDFNNGDLLLAISSDDPTTLAHAARMLLKSVRWFAEPLWRQDGFRYARGSQPEGSTMRNLMGQVDGTSNPEPGTAEFDETVWLDEGWLAGGTAIVLRRIRMELETWDMIDRPVREQAMGRDLAVGAPLTGVDEHDEPDFEAKDALGFNVIPDFAHIRRARMGDERVYRRSVNYDDGDEQGLLFVCYQRDPLKQFVPIQQRLDQLDLMNEWITHVGSAVFAIAPGWEPGGMLGETLLQS